MADPVTTIKVIEATAKVAKVLKETGALERFKNWLLREEPYTVVLVGPSGVGKSAVARNLRGVDSEISRYVRTAYEEHHKGKLDGNLLDIIDTPGQTSHKPRRLKAYRRAISSGRYGLLKLAADGYLEGAASVGDAVHEGRARADFIERNHDYELEMAREVRTNLIDFADPGWVVTLVTKADLWWAQQDPQPGLTRYESGEHRDLVSCEGRLKHAVMPYCSHRQLYFGEVPMSGYYSEALESRHREDFVNILAQLT